MKRSALFVVFGVLLAFAAATAADAQMMRHSGSADGTLVILQELGVVVGPQRDGDDLEVVTLLPDAKESEVEVKEGDLLLMVAGKRVRDLAALREAYDATAVGETLKLGFRRGDQRFLVSLEKEEQTAGERRVVMMGGPGGGGDMQPLMEFGVVLTEADGKVVVGMELPSDNRALDKDDVITAVNGKPVVSLATFRELYEALAVGETLALTFTRDGAENELSRDKIDASGMIRMRSHP